MTNGFIGYQNPYSLPYQPRMNALENQYQHYTQQIPSVPQQGYRVIAVSNVEEANATTVDTNGMPTFFYNKGQGEIYLKQFDIATAGAIFQRFELVSEPQDKSKQKNVSVDYTERLNSIESKLDSLASILDEKPRKKRVEE